MNITYCGRISPPLFRQGLAVLLLSIFGAFPAIAQEYATWVETGSTNTGTGTFTGAAIMPDFTWSVTGDVNSASIDNAEDWDGTRGIEVVYGEANTASNLNVRVNGNTNPDGLPINSTATIVVSFNSPTPATGWAFSVHDLDVDQAIISALDSSNNPVSTAVIDSWFEAVFDISDTDGSNIPTWDVTAVPVNTGVVVGASSTTMNYTGLVDGAATADTESGAAWFSPNISLNSITIAFEHIDDFGTPSFHWTMASQQTALLTLEKTVVGGTATDTDWTLEYNGSTSGSGAEGDAAITNAWYLREPIRFLRVADRANTV